MRLILWLLLLVLVYWAFRRAFGLKKPSDKPAATDRKSVETMVPCSYCKVHLPVSEAVQGEADRFFCSDAHLHLHASREQ
jgi:hypothetical protein